MVFSTVFLDFTNEDDFKSLWFRRSTEIDGQVMWLEKWTPDFNRKHWGQWQLATYIVPTS